MFSTHGLTPEITNLIRRYPMFKRLPDNLITTDNAKTVKGKGKGYITYILYMSPSNSADPNVNLCSFAKAAGCLDSCLYTAGRGQRENVHAARVRKTLTFIQYQPYFMRTLEKNIRSAIKSVERKGLIPVFRLNGTSDVDWQKIKHPDTGLSILDMFPTQQFYDYTKSPFTQDASNYHVTFSYSHRPQFKKVVEKSIKLHPQRNIAVVMRQPLASFGGRRTINGDATDLRFLDESGVVVALKAKGQAKQDRSGFVV